MTKQWVASLRKASVPITIIWKTDPGYIHWQQEETTVIMCGFLYLYFTVHMGHYLQTVLKIYKPELRSCISVAAGP